MRSDIRYTIASFLFFISAAILATYPLIFQMHSSVYGPFFGTDIRGAVWFSWWYKYAHNHGMNFYFCPFMNAPFGLDFTSTPFFWISLTATRVATILTNPLFALNLLSIGGLAACGIITFLFVRHLTSSTAAGLVTGFIFAFAPYHLNKLMEFSFPYLGSFFVFYVFCLIKLLEEARIKTFLAASIAFALLLAFSTYYAYFAGLFTLALAVFLLFFPLRRENNVSAPARIKKSILFLLFAGSAIVFGAAINGPSIFKILQHLLSATATSEGGPPEGYVRSFDYLISQSARPLSYLLPASTHPVFGHITKRMFGSLFYGKGPIEQTLYLGWIPLLLAFGAFFRWKKTRRDPEHAASYRNTSENFYIGFFLCASFFFFICSMPPSVDLGFFEIHLPSFYLHRPFPMFRAYARCGIAVLLCVCVLAGYGVKFLLERMSSSRWKTFTVVLLMVGAAFEFTNIPPWRVTNIFSTTPEIYRWLTRQEGDITIAEYPMPAAVSGEAFENYDYMFYQTLHEKKLINGASVGTKFFKIREKITKLDAPDTASILKTLGAKFVIVHLDAYESGEYKEASDVIGRAPRIDETTGYRIIHRFGNDLVCEIVAPALDPRELNFDMISPGEAT